MGHLPDDRRRDRRTDGNTQDRSRAEGDLPHPAQLDPQQSRDQAAEHGAEQERQGQVQKMEDRHADNGNRKRRRLLPQFCLVQFESQEECFSVSGRIAFNCILNEL